MDKWASCFVATWLCAAFVVAQEPSSDVPDHLPALLRLPADLEIRDKPLHLVAKDIAEMRKVDVVLDRKSLSDAGIPLDSPVNIKVGNVSLDAALRLMLRDLDLTYVWDDDAILLTTEEAREEIMRPCVFPVGDLVFSKAPDQPGAIADYDTLLELLPTHISPDRWPAGTGPGPFETLAGSLVARLDDRLKQEVQQLIHALRIANQPTTKQPLLVGNNGPWSLLRGPSHAVMPPTASDTALDDLRAVYKRPFLIDRRSMDDAVQVMPDSLQMAGGTSLYAAMKRMLDPHKLKVDVFAETIQIVPASTIKPHHTCIFPVDDLVNAVEIMDRPLKPTDITLSSLEDSMRHLMNSRSGKPLAPTITGAALPKRPLLVVSARLEDLLKVERVLDELRAAKKRNAPK